MLTEEMKRDIEQDLFYASQHVISGRLAAYIAEVKATKPCVANPDACDYIVEFFEAFQNQKQLFERHFKRWESEAARIKEAPNN